MCVIIALKPGILLPYELFETACFNNPHGYGIVMKDGKRLQTIRKAIKDIKTEANDPQEIYKILEDNKEIERFIHLRWKTEGDLSEENVHPFDAYTSKTRQVKFMHNGTLYRYKPDEAFYKDTGRLPSDSWLFNNLEIQPALLRIKGVDGFGDIHDPYFKKIINKDWNEQNRGILISNDQEPLYLHEKGWHDIEFTTGGPEDVTEEKASFRASNNEYFKEVRRGPEYDRRQERKRFEEEQLRGWRRTETGVIVNKGVAEIGITPLTAKTFEIRHSMVGKLPEFMNDYDMWETGGFAALGNLTAVEIEDLITEVGKDLPWLMMQITSDLYEVHSYNQRLEEKLDNATKLIATLQNELKKRGGKVVVAEADTVDELDDSGIIKDLFKPEEKEVKVG